MTPPTRLSPRKYSKRTRQSKTTHPIARVRSQGFAMILVLIAIAIATIVSLSMLTSLTPTSVLASNTDHSADATAVAVGGLDAVESYVLDPSQDWATAPAQKNEGAWYADTALGNGTYSISAERTDGDANDGNEAFLTADRITVTSVGQVNGVTAITTRILQRPSTDGLRVLLVLRNVTDIQAGGTDEDRYNQLVSWGYNVTAFDDSSSQTDFDTAFSSHDVVYVPENADWVQVQSKLKYAPIGVVNELAIMRINLGLAYGYYHNYDTTIPITDNTHTITTGFPLGDLTVTSASERMAHLQYTLAPSLMPLAYKQATVTNDYVQLAVIEKGGTMYGGDVANGRRVSLPWGESSFEITNLNADGLTILKRSLEWAGEEYTYPIAHWKLDEPPNGGGLAADDRIYLYTTASIDSYDSALGVYGGANVSSAATVSSNSIVHGPIDLNAAGTTLHGDAYASAGANPNSAIRGYGTLNGRKRSLLAEVVMDNHTAPTGMPASQGSVVINTDTTWNTDQTFSALQITSGAAVTIDGNLRAWSSGSFYIKDASKIVFTPGSTLELYVATTTRFQDSSISNTSDDPSRLTVINYNSTYGSEVLGTAQLSAIVRGDRGFVMRNDAQFFGSAKVDLDVKLYNASQAHLDTSLPSVGAAGSIAQDDIGIHHGLIVDGPTLGVPGKVGTAMSFDGVDDHIEVAHSDAMLIDAGTAAFWFKPTDTVGYQGLFSKDAAYYGTGGHLQIHLNGSRLYVRIQTPSSQSLLYTSAITAGSWHHVAFAFGPDGAKLYLDGVEVDTDPYTGGLGTSSGGAGNFEPLVLGANTWHSADLVKTPVDEFFEGSMDDIRLYPRQLAPDEISTLANP